MDLLYDEIMLYHDETFLDSYIEDRMQNPDGITGYRFGFLGTAANASLAAAAKKKS